MKRSECVDGPRPCPKLGCRYHLLSDKLHPAREYGSEAMLRHIDNAEGTILEDLSGMQETCALDVADRGRHTLLEVGEVFGVTREMIRQIEARALRKLRNAMADSDVIAEYVHEVAINQRIEQRRLGRARADVGTKLCMSCGELLQAEAFSMLGDGTDALAHVCDDCEAKRAHRKKMKRMRYKQRFEVRG